MGFQLVQVGSCNDTTMAKLAQIAGNRMYAYSRTETTLPESVASSANFLYAGNFHGSRYGRESNSLAALSFSIFS